MTEAPSTVRAVARVGPAPEAAAGPPILLARSRPGYLGSFSLARLILVEVMLVLPIATIHRPVWLIATVAALCLGVAALALARSRGRWWTEHLVMRWRYRRRHSLPPDRAPDRRLRSVRALAPDLQVTTVAAPDGAPVGIGADGAGWYAIAALIPPPGMRGDLVSAVPLGRLAQLVADSGQPGAVVQVVLHTTPTPSPVLDPRQWCAASYRELLDRYGPVPANQALWIAVRLDAHALAQATVGGVDESAQAPAVVAGLIRRISRALDRAGVTTQVLDADGLLDALVYSCDLGPAPDRAHAGQPREDWPVWHSTGLAQTCFWIRRWPEPAAAGDLLQALATAPRVGFTSVAVVLEPTPDGVEMHGLARLAAPADILAAGCRTLLEVGRRAGGDLLRLDGEQVPAAYASAPTGGGAR
jgi:ESX secretion system protein EccE